MTMRNAGLAKAFQVGGSGATVTPSRFVKFDAADNTVIQAAAAADFVIGVSDYNPNGTTAATGEKIDVILDGVVTVTYGGNVTRGALVMTDSSGRAITATASAGANVRHAGVAMVSGVSGDLGAVLLSPGSFQG